MSELERLRRFEWNVLDAYHRGGDGYLTNAVKWLIDNPEYTPIEVESWKRYAGLEEGGAMTAPPLTNERIDAMARDAFLLRGGDVPSFSIRLLARAAYAAGVAAADARIAELTAEIAAGEECDRDHVKVVENYERTVSVQQARIAELEEDAARLDWIIDNCHTTGGGMGFTLSVYIPHDSECIRAAIDAARAATKG